MTRVIFVQKREDIFYNKIVHMPFQMVLPDPLPPEWRIPARPDFNTPAIVELYKRTNDYWNGLRVYELDSWKPL